MPPANYRTMTQPKLTCSHTSILLAVFTALFLSTAKAGSSPLIQRVAQIDHFRNMKSYKEREIHPATWACANYENKVPQKAHDALLDYRNGENEDAKIFDGIETFPLMKILNKNSDDKLCIFLDRERFCYPPAPNSKDVQIYEVYQNVRYAAVDMWGHSADERYDYYREKLENGINNEGYVADYDMDSIYLNYFPGNMKEVRVNTARGGNK